MSCRRVSFFFSVLLWAAPISTWAANITIDTVSVGNLGNSPDPLTGNLYGSVGYAYRIGTTEVTVGQYTAFLNAVADTDTYSLYNTSMASDLNVAGIERMGVPNSFTYNVIGSPNKPVSYVSWGDAARFSNWLHNGQPVGPQNANTTESGAYALNGATAPAALNAITRNSGAKWFIPTESEWYKAAYHQNDGVTGNYWEYPASTSLLPYSDQPPGNDAPTPSNTANFYAQDRPANGYDDGFAVTGSTSYSVSQNYLTDVGAYISSTSPYGTFDQGGNVSEWNESRGLRGGSWNGFANDLQSLFSSAGDPTSESGVIGFRVATVPEPTSLVLAVMACGLSWVLRKRKRFK